MHIRSTLVVVGGFTSRGDRAHIEVGGPHQVSIEITKVPTATADGETEILLVAAGEWNPSATVQPYLEALERGEDILEPERIDDERLQIRHLPERFADFSAQVSRELLSTARTLSVFCDGVSALRERTSLSRGGPRSSAVTAKHGTCCPVALPYTAAPSLGSN